MISDGSLAPDGTLLWRQLYERRNREPGSGLADSGSRALLWNEARFSPSKVRFIQFEYHIREIARRGARPRGAHPGDPEFRGRLPARSGDRIAVDRPGNVEKPDDHPLGGGRAPGHPGRDLDAHGERNRNSPSFLPQGRLRADRVGLQRPSQVLQRRDQGAPRSRCRLERVEQAGQKLRRPGRVPLPAQAHENPRPPDVGRSRSFRHPEAAVDPVCRPLGGTGSRRGIPHPARRPRESLPRDSLPASRPRPFERRHRRNPGGERQRRAAESEGASPRAGCRHRRRGRRG